MSAKVNSWLCSTALGMVVVGAPVEEGLGGALDVEVLLLADLDEDEHAATVVTSAAATITGVIFIDTLLSAAGSRSGQ
jgi:hypothetical protein